MQELYVSRQLTLERFAQAIGMGTAQVWGGSIAGENQVIACLGNQAEQDHHQQAVRSSTTAALDLLALFTLALLDQYQAVLDHFHCLFVSQVCVDVLVEEIQQLGPFNREHRRISLNGDRFTIEKIPQRITAHNIEFLERVLSFVRASCQVMPTTGAVGVGHEEFELSESVLGRASTATILVAKETGSLLYADDYVVRTLAKMSYSVNGAWTQPVLLSAHEQGMLNAAEYYDAIASLAIANYSYVSLDRSILMHVLESEQWVVTPQVAKAFGPLGRPETQWPSLLGILTDLVTNVWTRPIPLFHKQQITDLCLRTFAENRGGSTVLRMYQLEIQKRFPYQASQAVSTWFEVH